MTSVVGPQHVVDQRIDRRFHLAPGAGLEAELDPVARLALTADHLAGALQLLRHVLVGGDNVVEGVGDLADQADMVAGHAHRKVAGLHGLENMQEFVQVFGAVQTAIHPLGKGAGRNCMTLDRTAADVLSRLHCTLLTARGWRANGDEQRPSAYPDAR